MRAWLATLDEAALEASCRAERDAAHPFWVHLQHLYTHAIQQFSDCAVSLTLAGGPRASWTSSTSSGRASAPPRGVLAEAGADCRPARPPCLRGPTA